MAGEHSNPIFLYLKDLDLMFSSFMKLQEDPNKTVDPSAEHVWTFKSEQISSDLNLYSPWLTSWQVIMYVCCTALWCWTTVTE